MMSLFDGEHGCVTPRVPFASTKEGVARAKQSFFDASRYGASGGWALPYDVLCSISKH
jgi:hypothetical protein